MKSNRFPGKPLHKIFGIPLVEHVRIRCEMCKDIDSVIVATEDEEIKDVVEQHGGIAVMTSNCHQICIDRSIEALNKLNFNQNDTAVIVQGDEPLIRPETVSSMILALSNKIECANLCSTCNENEFYDENIVKAVVSFDDYAIYFSRALIPTNFKQPITNVIKQLGVYGFKYSALKRFQGYDRSYLEICESIDMNRMIEHHEAIFMVKTCQETIGVDLIEHAKLVEKKLLNDDLFQLYKKMRYD